ncbi:hypothetical protein [Janthinobacterium sp. 1_2014MBL_MicDiv]|uniref:hypothetical protein n=1 Tax=Janthinobacterium sp. 1_2014MBL_MicDiv TaxID=1644131 RepID=UPI0012EC966B|nr:hypothetical protein [Janthinobacterium sp. 1_2014MBL_MicDiv]
MMRTMIVLGAALSLWAAGNAHAADAPPGRYAAYPAIPAALTARLAYFQPHADLRVPTPYEPSTHSLLLVAIGLLGLRMQARTRNEKFQPLT